jgi:class 3 adenylate cyclase
LGTCSILALHAAGTPAVATRDTPLLLRHHRVVDWDATGLLDGAPDREVRRALLDELEALGFSLELLQAAQARGRLYALAGDQAIRPGLLTVRLAELAERLGQDVDWVRRMWRALGLTDPGPDVPVLAEHEVEVYKVFALLRELFDDELALSLARVHGASMARVAEAVAAAMDIAQPEMDMAHGVDELTASRTYHATTALMPAVTRALDLLYRQHLGEATLHFERAQASTGIAAGAPYCIAFADLCGFAAATERLSNSEITALLGVFETAAYDVAANVGGRCVKLIGDAAMLVCVSPDSTAEMAHRLVARMEEANDLLPVRVGMASGNVLVRDGDYFGGPVNLAARLLALAGPRACRPDLRLGRGDAVA